MILLLYIIIMTLHNITRQIDDAVDRRIPWELYFWDGLDGKGLQRDKCRHLLVVQCKNNKYEDLLRALL